MSHCNANFCNDSRPPATYSPFLQGIARKRINCIARPVTRADDCNALHWLAAFSLGGTSEQSHTRIIHAPTIPARAFSSMSIRARPDRNDPGMLDSPQNAPANCPQIAPAVSASSPRLTARKTASSKESAL